MSKICPMCDGEPALLGELGRLVWVRCIQCGWEWSYERERDHCPEDATHDERLCNACYNE